MRKSFEKGVYYPKRKYLKRSWRKLAREYNDVNYNV